MTAVSSCRLTTEQSCCDSLVGAGLAELTSLRLQEMGQSRRWLAREIGVSPQTINNLVNGWRPDVVTLVKLSPFLGQRLPVLLRLVGLAHDEDIGEEEMDRVFGGDWAMLEMVRLIPGLQPAEKKRLVQITRLRLGVN